MYSVARLGPRKVSAVRSLEVVASRRLPMYYIRKVSAVRSLEVVASRRSVRCPEFRGGRFSEVANVLHKRDFQSVTGALSAVGSVSASRSVRSGKGVCPLLGVSAQGGFTVPVVFSLPWLDNHG